MNIWYVWRSTVTQRDSYVSTCCTRLNSIADMLDNIDSSVPERILVMYTINGLNKKFKSGAINHIVKMY